METVEAFNQKVLEDRSQFLAELSGQGLEIGALHRPCPAPHLSVRYVDCCTTDQLYQMYPELRDQALVNVDILDDAESLTSIPDASQDFVIANHVIEHMRNPLRALYTWQRVLRPGGRLFLAVPDKHSSFDSGRLITPLSHILDDFAAPRDDRDYAHFEDFALHVSCRTFGGCKEEEVQTFAKKLWDTKYSIHYHVWDYQAFNEVLAWLANQPNWEMRVLGSRAAQNQEFLYLLERGVSRR